MSEFENSFVAATAKEARAIGTRFYFDPAPCPKGHAAVKEIKQGCVVCARARRKRWRDKNPERCLEHSRRWHAANPEKVKAKDRKSYYKNQEKRLEKVRRYKQANKGRYAMHQAERLEKCKRATPSCVSKSDLLPFYEEAALRTKKTGVQHCVDHIVPLVSPLVCGLNAPWNLQVITEAENAKKGNRWWPDMPGSELVGLESAA